MSKNKYANCDLRVIFWNFLQISLCFVMTKDHFKQKLLLWPHVPFKNFLNTTKFYIQIQFFFLLKFYRQFSNSFKTLRAAI